LEGIHNRTDFDLGRHQEYSKKNQEYFDEATKEKFIPYIIETSAGCDRSLLAALCNSYEEEGTGDDKRVVLRFHPELAPIKVAFLPLSLRVISGTWSSR
jgi:glycyl-tRNA synthetase